ncbi:MAG: DNA gyrase subunit A [Lachnospiraceae bacterium]|nr:DNA gyrase subunit A [Lachnospiraceae bacterium]
MEPNVFDKIKEVDLKKTMENSYLDYSMSVIVSRALPDVRDGLKPVQRRILYALHALGVTPDKKTKKCATIVGETMGKYHPHGDSSIYGALVGMGQPWNYRKVLIDKQGNFGSEDGDSPAAMRYTEAKMSKMASFMLDGINKDEVDFVPNFSNEYEEPVVLPARFPNLLVNGTTGIAVGMATNIPPHNFTEVVNAVIKIIDDKINDKETTIKDIAEIIKGPDFPTGALILGRKGIQDYLSTGRGKVKIRANCEIVADDKGKQKIIVHDLPYLVHRSELIAKIAELVKDKKIEGITHVLDVYGKKTTDKIEITLRKDAPANIILNQLYKLTDLQSSFSVIMLCIVNGEPKTLNILQMLDEFLKHQEIVVTRRTKFDLRKAEDRAHIVEGLLKAISIIDDVIKTIRESKDGTEAEKNLIDKFGFTEKQANAIVEMRLRALTSLELNKLQDELKDLKEKIAYYKSILADNKKLLSVIKEELTEMEKKEHDERTTKIVEDKEDETFDAEQLIVEGDLVITMSHLGYIKSMDPDTFRKQGRGGVGVKGMATIDNDFVQDVFMTTKHSTLMFITNLGRMYQMKGYEVPEGSRTARGTAIVNMLKLKEGEKVTAGIDTKDWDSDKYLVFATQKGLIKKTKLSEYNSVRQNGLKALNIKDGDKLITAKITNGNDDIFLITKNGLCMRFNEEKIRDMGRNTAGIKGIKVQEGDELIAMLVSNEGKELLLVTENGVGKRTDANEFATKGRGGKGMICYKPNEKAGKLVGAELVDGTEDLMIINEKGLIVRTAMKDIRVMGRSAAGVRIMKSDDGTKVTSVTKIKQ